MATGDLSFTRAGCSCIMTRQNVAIRRWIGARLPANGGTYAFAHDTLYFRKFEQSNTGLTQLDTRYLDGNVTRLVPSSITVTWSKSVADYGHVAVNGYVLQNSAGAYSGLSIGTGSLDGQTGCDAINLGVGEYVFVYHNETTAGPLTRISFTPGTTYRISLKHFNRSSGFIITGRNPNGTPIFTPIVEDYIVEQIWSDWLSPEEMTIILEDDLATKRQYSTATLEHQQPFAAGFFDDEQFVGTFGPRQVGGWAATDDPTGLTFPPGITTQQVGLFGNVGQLNSNGHAYRVINARCTGDFPSCPAFIASLEVFIPGGDSVQERTAFAPDTLVRCDNLNVECPAELPASGALATVNPPTTNNRRIVWRQNQRCP